MTKKVDEKVDERLVMDSGIKKNDPDPNSIKIETPEEKYIRVATEKLQTEKEKNELESSQIILKAEKDAKRKEFINDILLELKNKHNLKFVSNPKLGLYRYENGIYVEDFEAGWLKKFISDIRTGIEPAIIENIVSRITITTHREFEDFDKNTSLVPLLNCNYNLDTDKIEEFDPKIISTSRIPINYDPKADCPTIKKMLREIVDPLDIPVVEEIFGDILSKHYDYKYMFLFHGGIDSGKSTILNLITVFVGGKKHTSGAPPHTLAQNQFAAAELFGKRANISGDISSKMLSDTNLLKMLLGDDLIFGNKKLKAIIEFYNFARLLFACNTLPAIPDNDLDVFIEKVKVISVPNTIPKESQDHSLLGKMTTPEELSGLFNLAIVARKRLRLQNDYSNPLTKEQMIERYFKSVDPVVKFVREVIEISVIDVTPKDDIIQSFEDYCKFKKISYPKASNTFWKTFKLSLPRDLIDYNRKVGKKGNEKYAVGGIRLRNLGEIETVENTVPTPVIPKEITVLDPIISAENIDYGYDEPMPQPDPEPPLTAAEIAQMNDAFAAQKKQEEEMDEAAEEYEKTLPGYPEPDPIPEPEEDPRKLFFVELSIDPNIIEYIDHPNDPCPEYILKYHRNNNPEEMGYVNVKFKGNDKNYTYPLYFKS